MRSYARIPPELLEGPMVEPVAGVGAKVRAWYAPGVQLNCREPAQLLVLAVLLGREVLLDLGMLLPRGLG